MKSSTDSQTAKTCFAAAVQEAGEGVHETFELERGVFNGFGETFALLLDNSLPKIESSIKESKENIDCMSNKLLLTKRQMDKICSKKTNK